MAVQSPFSSPLPRTPILSTAKEVNFILGLRLHFCRKSWITFWGWWFAEIFCRCFFVFLSSRGYIEALCRSMCRLAKLQKYSIHTGSTLSIPQNPSPSPPPPFGRKILHHCRIQHFVSCNTLAHTQRKVAYTISVRVNLFHKRGHYYVCPTEILPWSYV